jgi:tetratricopeptide (TPR) repeat protein
MLAQTRDIVEAAGIRYHIAVADLFLAEIRRLEGWMNGDPTIRAEARTMLERAISFFREEDALHMLTLALPALAQVELEARNIATAQALFLETVEISQGMDAAMREIVALSGLARRHLAARDVEAALATSIEAIERFELLGEESKDEPALRFTHYQALLAGGQEAGAEEQLERAYQVLRRQADELRDPALRASLLNNVPPHSEILAIWEREHVKRKNVKEVAP